MISFLVLGAFTEEYSRELAAEISDGRVEIYPLTCNNGWLRDMGPTFVISQDRKEIRGIDWVFNGWGEIVPVNQYKQDATVARNYCKAERYKVYSSDLICEGGNLAFDGEGTVITTEAVHLDEKRNGKVKTKEEIEGILLSYLGAEKIIWIPEGVYGDETNGHVDNMVAFVRPGASSYSSRWIADTCGNPCAVTARWYRRCGTRHLDGIALSQTPVHICVDVGSV